MENNTQEFNFNGTPVRVRVDEEGEPWFCLADVCGVLGIANPSDCKTRLNPSGVVSTEVGVVTGEKADGGEAIQMVKMTFINEQNLYKVIFQSRKPEAEAFVDWVTGEVLPSIRKTGCYAVPGAVPEEPKTGEVMPDLLLSTARMIDALNRRIEAGENVPPHILKYAWNLANCTRTRTTFTLEESLSPESAVIRQVFSLFEPGEKVSRKTVYRAYCDQCDSPMSERRFWPCARKMMKWTDVRGADGRYIVINM